MQIELTKIVEKSDFMEMALAHFRELNPTFEPATDWTNCYFENIAKNSCYSLCWIMLGPIRAGFVLYGIEHHRFLPRQTGAIYELYVLPQHRCQRIATACACQVIAELSKSSLSKIQLEVVEGNRAAMQLWNSLGFKKVSERLTLLPPQQK